MQTQATDIAQRTVAVTNSFVSDLDSYTPYIADALPAHIPVERFKRVVVMAVSQNPDLLYANRRSLFTACQRCAVDGLLPDGREAALVVYNTRMTQRDPDTGVKREVHLDIVQYMPMIAGIRKRLRNSGEVLSAVAEAVFEKDKFRYALGDNAFIEHEPPQLGHDRGDVIGAWAKITLATGEVIRDVMDRGTIERARGQSRASNSLMWTKFYSEAAKKTVLRRAAKQAPFSADLERLFNRDDEPPLSDETGNATGHHGPIPIMDHIEHQEAEPEVDYSSAPPEPTGPQYAVVDLDGVESIFATGERACDALRALLGEAAGMGPERLDGFWESNTPAIDLLGSTGFRNQAVDLATQYANLRQAAQRPPTAAAAPAASAPSSTGDNRPATDDNRPDQTIPMVINRGKPDHRTWAVALFLPKLRRQRDSQALAFLLGDNEQNIEALKTGGILSKADLNEVTSAIEQQWKVVGNG